MSSPAVSENGNKKANHQRPANTIANRVFSSTTGTKLVQKQMVGRFSDNAGACRDVRGRAPFQALFSDEHASEWHQTAGGGKEKEVAAVFHRLACRSGTSRRRSTPASTRTGRSGGRRCRGCRLGNRLCPGAELPQEGAAHSTSRWVPDP